MYPENTRINGIIKKRFSKYVIEYDNRQFKWYTEPITDLGKCKSKYLSVGRITPNEYFMNIYVEEVFE